MDGSKKCSALSSTATSIVSPSRIRVAGLKRPTSVAGSSDASCVIAAIVSDVLGQLADLVGDRWRAATEKWIKISEPIASRSSA